MTFTSLASRAVALLLACLCFTVTVQAQLTVEGDPDAGKNLFRNYCATCHARDMKSDLTGPALGGTLERWGDYPKEDLYAWIRNSQALINEGHPRATELWDQWQPVVMNSFPNLTDEEIDNVLSYINGTYLGTYGVQAGGGDVAATGAAVAEESDNTLLFVLLAIILAVLSIVLARIVSNLNYMVQIKEGGAPGRRKSLVELLTSKGVIAFVIFALVVLGGYTTVNNAIMLGRQQGYQPEQPIKFSHEIHSGLQQIDCQYCHDGARRSKSAVIPAANTCMNCHRAVKVGSVDGTAELTKIFASVGYDPREDSYIENYEELTQGEIERIYKGWIADNYVQENGTLDAKGEQLIEDQWQGIVEALTGEDDPDIAGPIEWTRIHNLPDHVYFNHSQHVTVGGLECQTCHGPVEEMPVLSQYAPLSMGWCVNCHRQTEVQFSSNEYYDSYIHYHEEMASGERDGVTVEEIGGLECQKCHY